MPKVETKNIDSRIGYILWLWTSTHTLKVSKSKFSPKVSKWSKYTYNYTFNFYLKVSKSKVQEYVDAYCQYVILSSSFIFSISSTLWQIPILKVKNINKNNSNELKKAVFGTTFAHHAMVHLAHISSHLLISFLWKMYFVPPDVLCISRRTLYLQVRLEPNFNLSCMQKKI